MRLLAILALGYFLYRAVKTWMAGGRGGSLGRDPGTGQGGGQIDDVMVKDPQCGIYFSKRDGVSLAHRGETLDFCSPGCREEFLRSRPETADTDGD